jgi:FKBP-type peptidyl-prolyl cis-trans isomerase SlpA
MSNELNISSNTKVSLNFSITLETGDVVDSNFDRAPVSFVMGDGSLLPGFEACLLGLKQGDEAAFTIFPEDGFGEPQEANYQDIPRHTFSNDADLEIGMVFSFADAAGGELPGVVDSFDENTVRVNFNHPLAGRTLRFEVKIDRVEPAELH